MTELAAAIAVAGAALAAAFGNQAVIVKTIESMTRQPEMSNELRSTMFVGVALIEAMPIFAVLIALILVFIKYSVYSINLLKRRDDGCFSIC